MHMMESVDFGSAVSYNGEEYVFLASTDEIFYLAKILSKDLTQRVIAQDAKLRASAPRNASIRLQNILYSYVELKTEQFKKRLAHLHRTDQQFDPSLILDKICDLCDEDKRDLQKEILRENSAAPNELKMLVRKVTIH